MFSAVSQARLVKIAVLDTGYDPSATYIKYCEPPKDFTNTTPIDRLGHGAIVSSLIASTVDKSVEYCIYSLKILDNKDSITAFDSIVRALGYAITKKVDYINISFGGDFQFLPEKIEIERALNRKIRVIAAAGNEGNDLDKRCNFFPACYDSRIVIVGNGLSNENRQNKSNYGRIVSIWHNGTIRYKNEMKTGTSFSAPLVLAKMINRERSYANRK